MRASSSTRQALQSYGGNGKKLRKVRDVQRECIAPGGGAQIRHMIFCFQGPAGVCFPGLSTDLKFLALR